MAARAIKAQTLLRPSFEVLNGRLPCFPGYSRNFCLNCQFNVMYSGRLTPVHSILQDQVSP